MRTILRLSMLNTTLSLAACATPMPLAPDHTTVSQVSVDRSLVVDCLLPGTVRRLGRLSVVSMPRRSIKATSGDCEIRGGEYVAFDRADYATALRVLLPEAQKGKPEAQTYVGEIYEKGLSVAHDYTLAAQWYRKAAEQGYSRAQINLAFLYERGLGVPKDTVTALNWYRKASGLAEDELAFASAIEAERQALREEVTLRQREAALLRKQLDDTKRQLEKRSKRVGAIQRELEQARHKVRESQEKPLSKDSAAVQTVKSRADELEAQLKQAHQERASLEQEFNQQKNQLISHRHDAQSREESLQREIRGLEEQGAASKNQLDALQRALQEQQPTGAELERAQKKIAALETEMKQLEKLKASREEPLDGLDRAVAILSE